jgi:casein kinase II subunit alpha
LARIARVLGSEELYAYLDKYGIVLDPHLQQMVGSHKRRAWKRFVNPECSFLCSPETIDFVDKLLQYDHQARLTAKEAMSHPYLAPIVKYHQEKKA